MVFLLFAVHSSCAEEPPKDRAKSSAQPATGGIFRIGEMAQAAGDLRKAGEAFERFANSLDGLGGVIAESLATMSSEFDPFGYKTAFRTVGQQAETIQQQHNTIQALQEREIERLRSETRKLKRKLQKLRQRKTAPNRDSK